MDILSKSRGIDGADNVHLGPTPSRSWEGLSHREMETKINMRRNNAFRSRSLSLRKTTLREIPVSFSTPKCCPAENLTSKGRKKSTVSKSPIAASSYTYLRTKFKSIGPTNGSSEGLNSAIASNDDVLMDCEEEGGPGRNVVGVVRSSSTFNNASSSSSSTSSDFTPRTRVSLGNLRARPPPPVPPRRSNKTDVPCGGPNSPVKAPADPVPEMPPPYPPPKLSPVTDNKAPPIPPRRSPEQITKSAGNSPRAAHDLGNSVIIHKVPDAPLNTNAKKEVGEVQVDDGGHEIVSSAAGQEALESPKMQHCIHLRNVDAPDVQDDSGVSESESGSIITVVQSHSTTPCRPAATIAPTRLEISASSLNYLDDDEVCESVSEIQVSAPESMSRTPPPPISCSSAVGETERVNSWLEDAPNKGIPERISTNVTERPPSPDKDSAQFLLRPSSSESAISTEDSAVAVVDTPLPEQDEFPYNVQHRRRPRSRSCDFIRIHELAVEEILSQSESSGGDFVSLKRAQSLPDILHLDVRYGQVPTWDIKGGGDADKGSLSLLIPIQLFNRKFSVNLTPDVILTIAFLVSICIITFQIWPAPGQQNQWHW